MIKFRNFQNTDATYLAELIARTWNYNELTNEKVAIQMANVFMYSCLANQTFTRVAQENGQILGVIMGKKIKDFKPTSNYSMKLFSSIIKLLASKEGRIVAKTFSSIMRIDQLLLNKANNTYEGELAFFAVDPAHQGRGVGNNLFRSFDEYCKQESIDNFYLFTDTSCNYQFYEHRGMQRVQTIEHNFKTNKIDVSMQFYIYDNKKQQS